MTEPTEQTSPLSDSPPTPTTTAPREKIIVLPFQTKVDEILTRKVELRRVMGWEEDLIRDESGGMAARIDRVTRVLSMCTVAMGDKKRKSNTGDDHSHEPEFFVREYEEMPIPARTFAWIRLRQLSLGHQFVYTATCPHCKKYLPRLVFDLNSLLVTEVSDDFCLSETHYLETDGHSIEWRIPVGREEARMVEIKKQNPGDLESAEIYPFIVKIDGKKLSGLRDLKSLSGEARSAIRGEIMVGGIDLIVTNECPNNGGHEFPTALPIYSRSFFLPSAEKSSTKMKAR